MFYILQSQHSTKLDGTLPVLLLVFIIFVLLALGLGNLPALSGGPLLLILLAKGLRTLAASSFVLDLVEETRHRILRKEFATTSVYYIEESATDVRLLFLWEAGVFWLHGGRQYTERIIASMMVGKPTSSHDNCV